ncbi:protein rds1 [Pseudozyma hubeiensis SY62]|uniref:Protein rds1 n=1 Tax=Pseudozyma hubeiensis (strain SY62) TaxID=1305764 RepID=R9P147_PSEHS|nr:protein rds1 [Pseudozyma hubeiensis SY62]GAC94854.1 protein rds1 [Pseudozyma hubeiensis SY62]
MRSSTSSSQGSHFKRSYNTMLEADADSHGPSRSDQHGKRRMTDLQTVRALLLDRHWVDCLNCTKARNHTACLSPAADTQQWICERCRRIKKACSSGVWLKRSNVRAYQELLHKGVDVEHADQMVFGKISGLLGGPLDKHKEYGSAPPQESFNENLLGPLYSAGTTQLSPGMAYPPPTSQSSLDVKDLDRALVVFQRERFVHTPSVKNESSIAGSPNAPSDSTSTKPTTQLYFHKDNYHVVPLVPIKDMRELRQLFSDVRTIYLENWIESRILGEREQPDVQRLEQLIRNYDQRLGEALGIPGERRSR